MEPKPTPADRYSAPVMAATRLREIIMGFQQRSCYT